MLDNNLSAHWNSTRAYKHNYSKGFTIVELLIVVVVIAILASISIVSYSGITNQARKAAIKSDLSTKSKQLELSKLATGNYPDSLEDAGIVQPGSESGLFYAKAGQEYCLSATSDNSSFYISSTNGIVREGFCQGATALNPNLTCPSGFIQVPGDYRFGTDDFCIMKYEAKNNGSGTAVSQPAGVPWASTTQPEAVLAAQTACGNCQLITDRQWMTVAANVLSVSSNWTSGQIGNGYVHNGHVNFGPNNTISASSSDSDGMYGIVDGTGNGFQYNNRRTLTLTNGEVIWDLSGNIWEWTSDTIIGPQPGSIGDSGGYKEYSESTNWNWRGLDYINPSILESTVPGISNFGSAEGIGMINSNPGASGVSGLRRGGSWGHNSGAGVLLLSLATSPDTGGTTVGFRVTSPGL